MKIALIGLPQAGRRTLFSLLTGRTAPDGRKPGEGVEGVAPIRDARVDRLADLCRPKRKVYAENHFVLCPDAVAGEGAREWLDAARRCDLLCLVVRAFASEAVYHPRGTVDPARDAQALHDELMLADMALIEKRLDRMAREAKSGPSAERRLEQEALAACMSTLESGAPLTSAPLEPHQLVAVRSLGLLTLIPVMVIHNVSEDSLALPPPDGALAVSCRIEQEIAAMADDAERAEYLEAMGIGEPGLDRVNAAAYHALGLMSFYTAGKDECRAWTIRQGSPAPVAGGKIHSDIERGFIRVEVIKFDDFIEAGSEAAARERGKLLTKGRDYLIEDGDICHFLFNV